MSDQPIETVLADDEIQAGGPGDRRKRDVWVCSVLLLAVIATSAGLTWNLLPVQDAEQTAVAEPRPLSDEATKYLQDVEHLGGFVLGDLAFPKIAKALRQGDADALRAFFHPQFEGENFDPSGGTIQRYPFATFHTWREGDAPKRACDRDGFVRRLIEYRNEFSRIAMAKIKIMQMSPETYGQLDGPWKGTLKLILAGHTTDGHVAQRVIKFRCRISSLSDETPDQREWMTGCEPYAARYSSSNRFLMRDMTKRTGINTLALADNWRLQTGSRRPFLTGGLYTCDYNRDGIVDLLVTDKHGASFYEGRLGGTFVDVTGQVGLPKTRSLGAVFADFDGDGYEDLILARQLYRNDHGKRFVAMRPNEHSLYLHPQANNYSVVDYDRDGRIDLYVVGLPVKKEQQTKHRWIGKNNLKMNRLWHNLGNWQFEDATESTGTKGNGSPVFAAVWFDANGDHWPDVMTACELGTNDYLLNQGNGTFRTGKLPEGYGGFSMGITVSDIDNDGFGDPFVANMYSKAGERIVGNLQHGLYDESVDAKMRDFVGGNELYHNRGDGTFERIGQRVGINDVGWTYGVGYVDLNGDGLPDVYSPAGFQSVSPNKPDG